VTARKPRAYISGRTRGEPFFGAPLFDLAEVELHALGYIVPGSSPGADHGRQQGGGVVAAPRSYSQATGLGLGYETGQGAVWSRAISSVSAPSIGCPECSAAEGSMCVNDLRSVPKPGRPVVRLLCPGRLKLARELAESGELEVTVSDPIRACSCAWRNGRRMDNFKCAEHGTRSASNSRGGRKPAVSAEAVRRLAAGESGLAIAKTLGVSASAVYVWAQRAKDQALATD
jgi:hypothetical protein